MKMLLPAVLFGLLVTTVPAAAQVGIETDPGRAELTRSDLERFLAEYEEVLRSPAYSESIKSEARRSIDRIQARLRDGDFSPGDRLAIYVEGEPALPDTVSVESGPMIALPLFGNISLNGVLRSEVEEHLTRELGRFINQPVVRAKALMRVSIQGAVTRPGFYAVPADMLLDQALMFAGGPTSSAALDDLRLERGQIVLMEGEELQEAIRAGMTLDQLNLQGGDEIIMPAEGPSFFSNVGVIAGLVGSLSVLLFQLAR